MPEKVVSQIDGPSKKRKAGQEPRPPRPSVDTTTSSSSAAESSEDEDEDGLREAIRTHAYSFYLRHGGKEDEWGKNTERGIRREMRRKWRESEWARIRYGKQEGQISQGRKWVGESFVVGDFLGISVLDSHAAGPSASAATLRSVPIGSTSASAASPEVPAGPSVISPSTGASTFVTAHSHLTGPSASSPTRSQPTPISETSPIPSDVSPFGNDEMDDLQLPPNASDTALLRDPQTTTSPPASKPRHPFLQSSLVNVAQSDGRLATLQKNKGKGKVVRYADAVEEVPAPPGEVLARAGDDVKDTSAGAAQQAAAENEVKWGDVVMRDRMLVRVLYTKFDVPAGFDEEKSRTARNVLYEEWAEYLVVWRKDRLEIYEDYDMHLTEWFKGHKRLAYIIPLHGSRTRMCLFSFVDLTFCITCAAVPVDHRFDLLHSVRGEGSNIFVFKLKSRSRAVDWHWQLWRQLGGTLPPSVEVRCPALETRLRIDLPEPDDWDKAFRLTSRANVLALCKSALGSMHDWERAMANEEAESQGEFELAWRMGNVLDWIWLDNDVDGHRRRWAVLCGLALRQPDKPTHLEFRLGQHFPTHLHLRDGTRLNEPPAIEGYLDRIRPGSQTRQAVYLTTHDGNIFYLPPTRAHPPAPPDLPGPAADGAAPLRDREVRRGARQILASESVSDMRSVVMVRRAFRVSGNRKEEVLVNGAGAAVNVGGSGNGSGAGIGRQTKPWEEEEVFWEEVERTESDQEDEGGELGLAKHGDKAVVRMKRSFELVLKTGHVVRFEAYSRRVALEWIKRLRELIAYWRKRHHVDAREEMEIAQAGRARITPHMHVHRDDDDAGAPEPPPDRDGTAAALGAFYHWCTLDACRPILKSGKLFVRKGLKGQYKQIHLVLVPGHILQFHIAAKSSLHRRRKGGSTHTVQLAHAYVCSGALAAQALPRGQYNPNAAPVARRYQDGLEADDPEEDTLLMIWFKHGVVGEGLSEPTAGEDADDEMGAAPPPLSAKRKLVVFRTRSRLERDAWCWALNAEIERIVRRRRASEVKAREEGKLVDL